MTAQATTTARHQMNPNRVAELVQELLLEIEGPNASREGLGETPARVAKAFQTWFGGYATDIDDLMKVFEDGAEGYKDMVVVRDIPVYSHCEHHMAAIIGKATVAYIPNGKILGLSKINRLVDAYARRLQVQERLTDQIADAMFFKLEALGVAVRIHARHLCMESRGVKQNSVTTTTALRGVFQDDPSARAEFLSLDNHHATL